MPVVFVSMNPDHADGRVSSRNVCPVGAVSKITWSNAAVAVASPRRRENSSKAAISSVQEPENCSSMLATAAAGSRLPIRADHPLAIFGGRFFRVEIHRRESRHRRNGSRMMPQGRPQHFIEIRCRIGRDQQDFLSLHRQGEPRRHTPARSCRRPLCR